MVQNSQKNSNCFSSTINSLNSFHIDLEHNTIYLPETSRVIDIRGKTETLTIDYQVIEGLLQYCLANSIEGYVYISYYIFMLIYYLLSYKLIIYCYCCHYQNKFSIYYYIITYLLLIYYYNILITYIYTFYIILLSILFSYIN